MQKIPTGGEPGLTAVDLTNVTRRYGDRERAITALDDVSFAIARGEIFGILGESGAGKSTLLRLLGGIESPSSGQVVIDGIDLATLSQAAMRRQRRRIGTVFQGFNLLGNRTVRQNIELPLRVQRTRDPEYVDHLLEFVGLGDRQRHYPAQLSGGQRQRVGIARALVTRPSILLCDEPTSALDANTTADILRLLTKTRDELGTTVAIVTHELEVVKSVCERAALFESGKLLEIIDVNSSVGTDAVAYVEHARRFLRA